jgi:hypothetical protein
MTEKFIGNRMSCTVIAKFRAIQTQGVGQIRGDVRNEWKFFGEGFWGDDGMPGVARLADCIL